MHTRLSRTRLFQRSDLGQERIQTQALIVHPANELLHTESEDNVVADLDRLRRGRLIAQRLDAIACFTLISVIAHSMV